MDAPTYYAMQLVFSAVIILHALRGLQRLMLAGPEILIPNRRSTSCFLFISYLLKADLLAGHLHN